MAENIENNGCLQRDRAEHEGYAKASRSFNRIWKERDSAQPRLLEAILYKDNFNRAYKRVKANKGAPGIDGMTIEEALPYLKEHQQELTDRIYRGKYTPSPVSNLLANGAAPKDVQELLGHSDVSTTMNVYAHSTRDAKRKSVRLLDKVVGND